MITFTKWNIFNISLENPSKIITVSKCIRLNDYRVLDIPNFETEVVLPKLKSRTVLLQNCQSIYNN